MPPRERIKAEAYALGFDLAGIAPLGEMETAAAYERWVARGFAGDMGYMERGVELRRDSRRPQPGMCSAIVVAMDHGGREPAGPVARYARGDDYHVVMKARLRALHARLEAIAGRTVRARPYVDTGPVLERDLARQAGLGWFAKNTNLINPRLGSFFFLGALFTDLALEPDAPFEVDHCGTCTRCLDACPTHALVAPGQLDARRCLSYLTIELRGAIPAEFREPLHDLLYGCDICQDVCPWNEKFARALPDESPFAARPGVVGRDARTLARAWLGLTPESYASTFRGSAMKRAKLAGLRRNAAVVLGNVGTAEDVDVLRAALEEAEPLVREHARWALHRINARAVPPGAT